MREKGTYMLNQLNDMSILELVGLSAGVGVGIFLLWATAVVVLV